VGTCPGQAKGRRKGPAMAKLGLPKRERNAQKEESRYLESGEEVRVGDGRENRSSRWRRGVCLCLCVSSESPTEIGGHRRRHGAQRSRDMCADA
jgi:hypothetical protein